MSRIVIVKAAPGRRVLDPASDPPKPLPPGGRRVMEDAYWLRRLKAGEVSMAMVNDSGPPHAAELPDATRACAASAAPDPAAGPGEHGSAPEKSRRGKTGKKKE